VTLTRASSRLGCGAGKFTNSMTSGPPVRFTKMAFIVVWILGLRRFASQAAHPRWVGQFHRTRKPQRTRSFTKVLGFRRFTSCTFALFVVKLVKLNHYPSAPPFCQPCADLRVVNMSVEMRTEETAPNVRQKFLQRGSWPEYHAQPVSKVTGPRPYGRLTRQIAE
jgi:hypothetical protein